MKGISKGEQTESMRHTDAGTDHSFFFLFFFCFLYDMMLQVIFTVIYCTSLFYIVTPTDSLLEMVHGVPLHRRNVIKPDSDKICPHLLRVN